MPPSWGACRWRAAQAGVAPEATGAGRVGPQRDDSRIRPPPWPAFLPVPISRFPPKSRAPPGGQVAPAGSAGDRGREVGEGAACGWIRGASAANAAASRLFPRREAPWPPQPGASPDPALTLAESGGGGVCPAESRSPPARGTRDARGTGFSPGAAPRARLLPRSLPRAPGTPGVPGAPPVELSLPPWVPTPTD